MGKQINQINFKVKNTYKQTLLLKKKIYENKTKISMSDFNLKRQVSEEDNNIEKEEDEEIMLEDVTQEVTDFNLTPEYRAMGLPDHVGDVVIDDGFTFRDETTRGIDFLKP